MQTMYSAENINPEIAQVLTELGEQKSDALRSNWATFTPILLTLVDDVDTGYRVRGLQILTEFIEKAPAEVLGKATGLGGVLEDSVMPTMHFLPSLVPEHESATLLKVAFNALIALARKLLSLPYERAPAPAARTGSRSGGGGGGDGVALLGRVLREGVFIGYSHAKEYPSVVDTQTVATRDIMNELGVNGIIHLKVCGAFQHLRGYDFHNKLTTR